MSNVSLTGLNYLQCILGANKMNLKTIWSLWRVRKSLLNINAVVFVAPTFTQHSNSDWVSLVCNSSWWLWWIEFQISRAQRQMMCKWMHKHACSLPSTHSDHTQCLYLYCCSSVSSWVILDWSCGTDWACSWIIWTLWSPKLRASLASSARLLMEIIQDHQTSFFHSNIIQLTN